MRTVLPDVDMLCSLSSTDDVVAPFDACVAVLVYRSIPLRYKAHANGMRAKMDEFHCHSRCRMVFRLGRSQRNRPLEFRFPMNRTRSSGISGQITSRWQASESATVPPVELAVSGISLDIPWISSANFQRNTPRQASATLLPPLRNRRPRHLTSTVGIKTRLGR